MNSPNGRDMTLGHFALVSYIPDPLATFIDDLSRELSPGCNPHAHVTVLPPRPHHNNLNETIGRLTRDSRAFAPFRVELGDIEIFNISKVIYLGLASGAEQLRELYKALNSGALRFEEPFPYHPHITIAQDIDPADADRAAAWARRRWAEYEGPRGFDVTRLSFVQHVAPSIWTDVAPAPLGQSRPDDYLGNKSF